MNATNQQIDWLSVMERARRLDPDAFDLLVEEYAPRVRGFLRRFVPASDVDDLVQELFLRMVRTISSYCESGRLDAWVFQIARNLSRDHARTMNRKATAPLDSVDTEVAAIRGLVANEPARRMEQSETLQGIEVAIRRLPDAEREVILLRHFGRLTFEEIAQVMDTPLGTALARAHRGLGKLREWMENPHA